MGIFLQVADAACFLLPSQSDGKAGAAQNTRFKLKQKAHAVTGRQNERETPQNREKSA